jgi:Ran GTPase-activating protein (RanGAP) involved in mRNA processing and transport
MSQIYYHLYQQQHPHPIQLKETRSPFPFLALPSSLQSSAPILTTSAVKTKTSSYRNKKIEDVIKKYQSYSEINLNGENLTDDDMKIIVNQLINDKQCTKLNLENNKITPSGVSIIASASNNNSSLESLILNGNRASDPGVQFISKELSKNTSNLQTLGLMTTNISDSGTQHLAEILKTNQSLTLLNLADNRIGNRGVQSLFNVLSQYNTTLQWLYLHKNNSIRDLIVEPLIEILQRNQSLRTLDISNCSLSDNGKKKLKEAAALKTDDFKLNL